MQTEIFINDSYKPLDDLFLKKNGKVFLVCDGSYRFLKIGEYLDSFDNLVKFSDFQPNPDYESVKNAVELFLHENCNQILAVGGGSAIDLAKCVKLYAEMDNSELYLSQEIIPNDILLTAVPTTAGTGSEATRYAVIYYQGNKQSVTHESCIPSTVIFDPSVLNTLPDYQKKSTMLDALCHAIESFWSVNSTDESKVYSKQALQLILKHYEAYLAGDRSVNSDMLKASNLAGRAINITQTTAGHAMCYKLTSLYGIAHGHAAALCVAKLLPYMADHTDKCIDKRGQSYLEKTFEELAAAIGCIGIHEMIKRYDLLLNSFVLPKIIPDEGDIDILVNSVNPIRLSNHPIKLSKSSIKQLYNTILEVD